MFFGDLLYILEHYCVFVCRSMFGKVYVPIKDIGGNKPSCWTTIERKRTCMQTCLNNQINRGEKAIFSPQLEKVTLVEKKRKKI